MPGHTSPHRRVSGSLADPRPYPATRRFVYDADGRVMGEYGVSATDVHAEFIWASPKVAAGGAFGGGDVIGGYLPLATPGSFGAIQFNWVHGNHLGVPLVTTGASGALATTPGGYLAPGFPGQSRVLADLYYNRYRDYDPVTGRYVQADPIGLDGGANSFAYSGDGAFPNAPAGRRCASNPPADLSFRAANDRGGRLLASRTCG